MARLTSKQEAFALAVFKGSSATAAYRAVYDTSGTAPKTINEAASRLMKNSKIVTRLAELRAPAIRKAELSVERTLKEIARLAYSDPRALYDDRGNLKPVHELDDDTAATIASVEVEQAFAGRGKKRRLSGYTRKVKQWDKNAALEKAMKHLGLFERDNAQQSREGLVLKIETAKPVKR